MFGRLPRTRFGGFNFPPGVIQFDPRLAAGRGAPFGLMQARAQAETPPPAQAETPPPAVAAPEEEEDNTIIAKARPRAAYDGPLAMDASAARFVPKKPGFWDRVGFAGAALTEGPSAAIQARDAFAADQEKAFDREQTARRRGAAIETVRRILDREGDDDNIWRVAQMSATPEQFMDFYVKYKDIKEARALEARDLNIQEKGVDAGIRQGDRRLDLNTRELDANIANQEARLGLDWFDAKTRRDQAVAMNPSRDPLQRALMAADADRLETYEAARDAAAEILPQSNRLLELMSSDGGGGKLNTGWKQRFNPLPSAAKEEFQSIVDGLFPLAGAQLKGVLSETDGAKVTSALPEMFKSDEANRQIIRMYQAGFRRAADKAELARAYLMRDRSLERFHRLWSGYINDVYVSNGDNRSFAEWMSDQRAASQGEGALQ
jgi:hypothetical protein